MTYDGGRSLDDRPLAAYGGSGMELSPEDEDKIEAAPSFDAAPEDPAAAPPPPGAFAHATAHVSSTDPLVEGEPGAEPPNQALVTATAVASRTATLLRTSRPAQGVAFAGVVVVGLLLLLGGAPKPGAADGGSSASAAPVALATHEPGNATLVLTGKVEQSLSFPGMTGSGAPNAPIAATWSDTTTNTLGLDGAVDRGTRTTDEQLVLRFTVTVGTKPVSFTSTSGECTIGMAVNPTNVSGTFSCRNLKSDDGKYVVGATGTYRT